MVSTTASTSAPIRAAQYVRMSTDHQKFSISNQHAVIGLYAADRGIEVVRTYIDSGRSGLTAQGRPALLEMLDDVQSGAADFTLILIYDISRWGRFQNCDESAYYEHICKRAGVGVRYCAEDFENDGSLPSMLLKWMKRAMAAEYSRELSDKVFAGHRQIIERGFKAGGSAGYGLRRMLCDENGRPKMNLAPGERKSIAQDRVRLVPGPVDEVEMVRRIFHMFVNQRMTQEGIASELNEEGKKTHLNRPWSSGLIRRILISEKYIGNLVYNRQSRKLKKRVIQNSPERWIRAENVIEPIVHPALFRRAHLIIKASNKTLSDEEMLDGLRRLLKEKGEISRDLIDKAPYIPSGTTYLYHFGSLRRCYELIGYTLHDNFCRPESFRSLDQIRARIIAELIARLQATGLSASREGRTSILQVSNGLRATIFVSRFVPTKTSEGYWVLRGRRQRQPDLTVTVRMARNNEDVADYFVLPTADFPPPNTLCLSARTLPIFEKYRHQGLEEFIRVAGAWPSPAADS
jgi:DNA invertase Pin-like site-specific DNA recombinase